MKKTKYLFKCMFCNTVLTIETSLEDHLIKKDPECPCGYNMLDMASPQYAYGITYITAKETDLGIDSIENPDICLCLDCQISKNTRPY